MTESLSSAAEQLFAALAELRQATGGISFTTLVRQAAAQQPPLQIRRQRLSDWFGGKAVPADPAVVRFLVEYLQPRATRTSGYRQRPLLWWLELHRKATQQRQVNRDDGGHGTAIPQRSPRRLGRPVGDCDPLVLEVHPAIQVPNIGTATVLPEYVPRAHDVRLRETVDLLLEDGQSRLVTLVGGSSTGKTRACWELARYLESKQPGRWWLWHPYDPTRPEAALADLSRVGADTIVWLNEAQDYLVPTDARAGERIAAGLRTLLNDPDRRPVLVLATMWPDYLETLITRPASGLDVHGQARELLTGSIFTISDAFTPAELAALHNLADRDPRLKAASEQAQDGQITQYLAGVPELLRRYRNAPPAARAVVHAAIDCRRLGHPLHLSHDLLMYAAPGYLTDTEWDHLFGVGVDRRWEALFEEALAYTSTPCHGTRGPVTQVWTRPQPGREPESVRVYRLADYLEQMGFAERRAEFPPSTFWDATAHAVVDTGLLETIGKQAEDRGRQHRAAQLYTRAAELGSTAAMVALARLRERGSGQQEAFTLLQQAATGGNAEAMTILAYHHRENGDRAAAEALARSAAANGQFDALRGLVQEGIEQGDFAGAQTLALFAAEHGDADLLTYVAHRYRQAGDHVAAEEAAVRAAQSGDPGALDLATTLRRDRGDVAGAEHLCRSAIANGSTAALWKLAEIREAVGDHAEAAALYRQAAERGEKNALLRLAEVLERSGDLHGAAEAYRKRDSPLAWSHLVQLQHRHGDHQAAFQAAVEGAKRGDVQSAQLLVEFYERVGESELAEDLVLRMADRAYSDTGMEIVSEPLGRSSLGPLQSLIGRRRAAGDAAGADALARKAEERALAIAKRKAEDADTDRTDSFFSGTQALTILARKRRKAGDSDDAEELFLIAAEHGDNGALAAVAELREERGDAAGANAAALTAADRGSLYAIQALTRLRRKADPDAPSLLGPFGLNDDGTPADRLNF